MGAFLLVIAALLPLQDDAPTWTPRPGEHAAVHEPGASGVCVATDLISYSAFLKTCAANDRVGLRELYRAGRVVDVADGTPCLVLEYTENPIFTSSMPAVRVRFRGGPLDGRAGWMMVDQVRPLPPP